jgi:hypothetical protein
MAPSKKRKEPPQSNTLFNFFSGVGEQKGKLSMREPRAKAKRVMTQEIIILDSDDEQSAPTLTAKPRTSPTPSVHEIVEDEPTKVTSF